MERIDITGFEVDMLTVIKRTGSNKQGESMWFCECECGGTTVVRGSSLRRGYTTHCGCLTKRKIGNANRRHGLTKTRTHEAWLGMKKRCLKPNSKEDSKNYKSRGITVCDRWLYSFEAFLEDMGECPKGMSLERRNNDKGYEPNNCRWADRRRQANNRRRSILIKTPIGRITAKQASRRYGVNYGTLIGRINRGWPEDKLLSKSDHRKVGR